MYPANQFPSGKPPRTLADKMGPAKKVFESLYNRGQFMPPAGRSASEMPEVHEQRVRRAQALGTLRKS